MSAKHWKKRFAGGAQLDFSPGLLRIQAQPPTSFARVLIDLKAQPPIGAGVRYPLAPGMQAKAAIHLGARIIHECLLSPVLGAFQKAGRERR